MMQWYDEVISDEEIRSFAEYTGISQSERYSCIPRYIANKVGSDKGVSDWEQCFKAYLEFPDAPLAKELCTAVLNHSIAPLESTTDKRVHKLLFNDENPTAISTTLSKLISKDLRDCAEYNGFVTDTLLRIVYGWCHSYYTTALEIAICMCIGYDDFMKLAEGTPVSGVKVLKSNPLTFECTFES